MFLDRKIDTGKNYRKEWLRKIMSLSILAFYPSRHSLVQFARPSTNHGAGLPDQPFANKLTDASWAGTIFCLD